MNRIGYVYYEQENFDKALEYYSPSLDIADKLMEVRDEAVKEETKSAIKKIARELQKTSDDEICEEFEIRFRQGHNDFYDKLIQ